MLSQPKAGRDTSRRVAGGPLPITAVILTYNEERNLEAVLQSLCGWVAQVFIVDSGSTDATVAIAERYGASIVRHPFETHARQWAWALEYLPCHHDWVLGLDADQRVTPELKAEIVQLFTLDAGRLESADGFYVKRRQMFRGRWIRHGGYYPKYLLKLVRRQRVCIDGADLLDHHFYVSGRTAKLRNDLIEENKKEDEIAFWIEKHVRYAALLAREELIREVNGSTYPLVPSLLGNPDQRSLWLKRVWSTLPRYVRPFLYFVYRYLLRLGFLDGKEGLIFHFLHACWFRLLVDIQVDEARAAAALPNRPREPLGTKPCAR